MRFYREYRQEEINMYKRWVKQAEDALKDSPKETSILWEVGNTVETKKISCSFNGSEALTIYCEPLEPYEFDDLLDTIDNVMMSNDCPKNENVEENTLSYISPGGKQLRIYLRSTECRTINTGKLVPEQKQICNFIKED